MAFGFASRSLDAIRARLFRRPHVEMRWAFAILLVAVVGLLPVAPSSARPFGAWALLPPALALALVIVTGSVIASMFIATLAGGIVVHGGPFGAVAAMRDYFVLSLTDAHHLLVLGFATCVLGTVEVTRHSGATLAVVTWVRSYLNTRRKVQVGATVAGVMIFFDDYANSMILGPTFRPLTDRFGISREKLAYIVDSTAAPISGIALVSTWVGYEVGVLGDALASSGVSQGAYAVLVQALPTRFYCVFALALVFVVALSGRDFGPMLSAETQARVAVSSADEIDDDGGPVGRRRDFVLPILVLVVGVALGLVADGGGLELAWERPQRLAELEFWRDTLAGANNSVGVLFSASLAAAVIAVFLPLVGRRAERRWTGRGEFGAFARGARLGVFPLFVLVCAWAIGAVCKDLGTGATIAQLVQQSLPSVFVPLVTFLAAALTALMTGTSWGTMAILVPAAVPLGVATGDSTLLLLTIAAVMDGAIFGDHCSPISDTTIISAASCRCGELAHVRTQLPYALLAMTLAAGCGYLGVALGAPIWVAYASGLGGLSFSFVVFGRSPD